MPLLRVQPDDAPAISRLVAIGRETFTLTFAESNDPADLQMFLDTNFAPDRIAQEVAHAGSLHYLLTDDAGDDLGLSLIHI